MVSFMCQLGKVTVPGYSNTNLDDAVKIFCRRDSSP